VTHVARLRSLSALHQASNLTLLWPISGMEAKRKDNIPSDAIRTQYLSGSVKSSGYITLHNII
jgi:hypothetical protein